MLKLGKETKVRALGEIWTVGRLELSVLEGFIDWVRTQAGDPFAGLDKLVAALPHDAALALINEAKEKRDALEFCDLNSPYIAKWMATARGNLKLLELALRLHHPEMTADTAFRIFLEIGQVQAKAALQDSSGQVSDPAGGGRGNARALDPASAWAASPGETSIVA